VLTKQGDIVYLTESVILGRFLSVEFTLFRTSLPEHCIVILFPVVFRITETCFEFCSYSVDQYMTHTTMRA
jgi:hypothetical protein